MGAVQLVSVVLLLCLCPGLAAPRSALDWTAVDRILDDAINQRVFPGCVAAVATPAGQLYLRAFGTFTYGQSAPASRGVNPEMAPSSLFDLASLTKVISTTSAVALLYQQGLMPLDQLIASPELLGPNFAANGKAQITVRNLLLHNAGFPPDPRPNYWNSTFGCPASASYHPEETFSCVDRIYTGLLAQDLINPIGAVYVYSDLSFITLAFCVGRVASDHGLVSDADLLPACAGSTGMDRSKLKALVAHALYAGALLLLCAYEAFARLKVFGAMGMAQTGFLPPPAQWPNVVPSWNDTQYRHRVVQGQVSDGNSYSAGGIAGHAGLFSTAGDLVTFMNALVHAPAEATPSRPLNSATVSLFTTVGEPTQSSRALGWRTNGPLNGYKGCGELSEATFTHTGFTGTQVCGDPERQLVTVLLTNRVYPEKFANFHGIHVTRQAFNNAVKTVVDGCAAACDAEASPGVCTCLPPPPPSAPPGWSPTGLQLGLAASIAVLAVATAAFWYWSRRRDAAAARRAPSGLLHQHASSTVAVGRPSKGGFVELRSVG